MKKSSENKFSASYGQLLNQRSISAKPDKNAILKPSKPSLNRSSTSISHDFLNNLKHKLMMNSPKLLEKYRNQDIQSQFLKIKSKQQIRPGSVSLSKAYGKNETPKDRMNVSSEEKKYFYSNLIDKKIRQVQEKMNQSDTNFYQKKVEKNLHNDSTPDFKKLQTKLSNLEQKIQQLKQKQNSPEKSRTHNMSQNLVSPTPTNKVYSNLKQQIQSFFKKRGETATKSKDPSKTQLSSYMTQVSQNPKQSMEYVKMEGGSIKNYLSFSVPKSLNSPFQRTFFLVYVSHVFRQDDQTSKLDPDPKQKKNSSSKRFLQKQKIFQYIIPYQNEINLLDKKTLVFDLDETLIHCNENPNIPSDVSLQIPFPNGEVIQAGVNVRPHCRQILQELSQIFEIMVFTASHSCYANVVLDHLDPQRTLIQHRLFRESCIQSEEGFYIKDLRVINRPLSNMVLVDNAAYSFAFQVENGIPILNFYNNKEDSELLDLMNYLKQLNKYTDVREGNKHLKIDQFSKFQDPQELIYSLFPDYLN